MTRRLSTRDVDFLRENRLGICSDCIELIAEIAPESTRAPCDFCDGQNGLGIDSALVAGVAVVTDDECPPTERNVEPFEVESDPQKMNVNEWPANEVDR